MKHAYNAGTSPSTISSILMFNVLLILLAGVTIFNERHKVMKYLGGMTVFISLIVVATQRNFEAHGTYTQNQNEEYRMALVCVGVTTVCWGLVAVMCKYATYFYDANSIEFGTVAMTLSGLYGSLSITYLVYHDIPLDLVEGHGFLIPFMQCIT